MGILTKEAREEICRFVEALHLEKTQCQKENEALKRKLQLIESQLRTMRGPWEGGGLESSGKKPSRSVGVQVGDEYRGEKIGGYLNSCFFP